MYCIVRKNIENKQKEWLMPPTLKKKKKIYGYKKGKTANFSPSPILLLDPGWINRGPG
jgi:hypothetical protein